MSRVVETVIIGGGISGLACGRQLCNAGRPFVLLTDRIGGRMYHSTDGSMNLGASYVTADYKHVLRYVGKSAAFRLRDAAAINNGAALRLFSWRNALSLLALRRVVGRVRELRRALNAFRAEADRIPANQLIGKYPLLARYRAQPATEVIRELGIERLHRLFFSPVFQTTCFIDATRANALFYLSSLFPLIVPTWIADFSRTYQNLTRGYTDSICVARVTSLCRVSDGLWEVATASGPTYMARNVVLAIPYHNASQLYAVPKPYLATQATISYVKGIRKWPFKAYPFVLMHPANTGVALLWRQGAGDQVFATRRAADLGAFYEEYQVVSQVTWKTAVVVSDATWVPMRLEETLYLVGDYNMCGLEDCFITGLCAANHIITS